MSLYRRKDSSVWWLKLSVNGQTIQRSTGTSDKAKAQEYHDRLKAEMWEQSRLGVKPRRTWQEAVVRWLEDTQHKATHREDIAKLKWLHPYLGHLTLNDITRDVLDDIAREKRKPYTIESKTGKTRIVTPQPASVNRYLALIRSILIRARDEWEWIEKVPKVTLFKEPEGRERAITPEQAKRLLEELPEHQRDYVLFALLTGLRQSNVLGLEWSCVNLEQRHAWVQGTNSKNRKAIAVPLNDDAMVILQRQIGKHPVRVFTFRGKPIANANTKAWHAARRRAGIDNFRWHDLRHTWASWHRQAGTPTFELQRLGGWKTGSMVERYAHVAPDALAGAAGRLENFVSGYDLATVAAK